MTGGTNIGGAIFGSTIVGGTTNANDVPGYTKQNAYRNWGDIFRVSKDFDFGWLTGQVRTGVWWETSTSQRARSDFDATQCFGQTVTGCNPFNGPQFPDASLVKGQKSAPFGGGYFEYQEHTGLEPVSALCRAGTASDG